MKLQRPDPGIDVAKSGLHGKAGLFFDAGVFEKGEPSFGIQDLDPYLLFDSRESMIGTLENPTLDLDPSKPDTLNVITATRSGTATYTDVNGNIATAAADTVRVDHVDGVPMILVEPSSENLFRNSQDLTASPNNVANGTITQESETFKGQPVFRFTDDTSSGEHRLSIPAGSVTASRVIVHFFVKPDTCTKFCITYPTAGDAAAAWNLQSGSALGSTVGSAVAQTIEDAGDGWFKVSMTYDRPTATTTGHNIQTLQDSATSAANRNYQGDGTLSFLMTMPQLEYGEVQTSFIPTSGSTVTRAADNLEITGSDFDFYNASEGTVYAEFLYDHDQTSKYVYSITETGDNEIRSQILASMLRTRYTVNSSHLANLGNTEILKGSLNRAAFSYKTDNFRANLNGGSDTEDFSGTASINPIKLAIGSRGTANHLNGRIRRILYWPYSSDRL
jgi:hypothetical protein